MENNIVLIGKKPVTNYVLACLTLLQNGHDSVVVKARGMAICRAVDAAQILTKRFIPDIKISKIDIDTEQVKSVETGEFTNVSSMIIHMGK